MNSGAFAFVIVTYNETRATSKLVEKLLSWKSKIDRMHIIIVDNCSSDDTFTVLTDRFSAHPIVDIIQSERNGGYGAGNNLGAEFAREHYDVEYTVIANPDILIEEDDFEYLLEAFQLPGVATVTAVMKNIDGKFDLKARSIPNYEDDIRACFFLPAKCVHSELMYADSEQHFFYSDFIPGAFFIIKSSIFENIGGFDENVFLFCEERIIGKKIKDAGYRQVICKNCFFIHEHSVTIKSKYNVIKVNKMTMRSRLYYNKNYSNVSCLQYLFLQICSALYIFQLLLLTNASEMKSRIWGR